MQETKASSMAAAEALAEAQRRQAAGGAPPSGLDKSRAKAGGESPFPKEYQFLSADKEIDSVIFSRGLVQYCEVFSFRKVAAFACLVFQAILVFSYRKEILALKTMKMTPLVGAKALAVSFLFWGLFLAALYQVFDLYERASKYSNSERRDNLPSLLLNDVGNHEKIKFLTWVGAGKNYYPLKSPYASIYLFLKGLLESQENETKERGKRFSTNWITRLKSIDCQQLPIEDADKKIIQAFLDQEIARSQALLLSHEAAQKPAQPPPPS